MFIAWLRTKDSTCSKLLLIYLRHSSSKRSKKESNICLIPAGFSSKKGEVVDDVDC